MLSYGAYENTPMKRTGVCTLQNRDVNVQDTCLKKLNPTDIMMHFPKKTAVAL